MIISTKNLAFELQSVSGSFYNLTEYCKGKRSIIIFSCNHCPYAVAYIARIRQINRLLNPQKEVLFVINSNDPSKYPQDSYENMIPMDVDLGTNGHYLFDESQEVANYFKAQKTPEAFLFDESGALIYHGAIDDNYKDAGRQYDGLNANRELPSSIAAKNYLWEALLASRENKIPDVKKTMAVGCSIKWK